MSLYISLTGLRGAQNALTVTSNNIANANSTGFKRSSTSFSDLVAASGLNGGSQGTGTVQKATLQNFSQGLVESTGNTFDLALSGEGFFAVKPDLESVDTVFSRNGEFRVDENNYVRGTSGQHLLAYPVNADGRPISTSFDALRPLQLPATSGAPVATSQLELAVNLPSNAAVIPDEPRYQTGTPYAFDPNDPLTYNMTTSATFFDSNGDPLLATVYYVRTKGPDTTDSTSRWAVHMTIGRDELTPSGGPIELTFDDRGQLTAPLTPVGFDAYNPGNGADPVTLSLDHGTTTTQVASPFTVFSARQDGVPPGKLDSVTIDETGLVKVGFSNGEALAVGKVAIAKFGNPAALTQIGGASYRVSGGSGPAEFGEGGGSGYGAVLSGALERANVDITEELVNLITAQRNFQANAKAIETDNAMTQSIINLRN